MQKFKVDLSFVESRTTSGYFLTATQRDSKAYSEKFLKRERKIERGKK